MGRTYTYYKLIRKTIIQFMRVFTNIEIGRYDTSGNFLKKVVVPARFSPKSKAYLWVKENSRNEEMLPMISVDLQAIDFDATRMVNKHSEIKVSENTTAGTRTFVKNAIPFNFTFNVRIWALHMVDIDQIYEQILPWFSPQAMIRIYIPELDANLELKVVLQSCSPEMTDDVSEEEARVLRWSTMFVVQGYLTKPLQTTTGTKIIKFFMGDIYLGDTTADIFDDRDTTSTYTSGSSGAKESIYMEAIGYDEDAEIMYNYEIFGAK